MATENTGAAEGQESTATQPQAGDSKATPKAQAAEAEGESTTVDVAVLQRELAEARREAAKYRTDAKKLTDAQKAAEEAALPEKERLERRISELERDKSDLERERQELRVRESVVGLASRMGFADPIDAFRLLDVATLEYDADGSPKGVDKALGDLLKAKPYLASAAVRATGSIDSGVRKPDPANVGTGIDRLRYAYDTESKTKLA